MLPKNLMEDKQLDFNQPLLSVRRFSSTTSSKAEGKRKTDDSLPKIPPLPLYRSELKSGPVRNPGTVPFLWEQTPGRPKNESKSQIQALQRPPIAPKLPPGRILNVKQQGLLKGSEVRTVTRSQNGNDLPSSQNVSSLDKNVTKYKSSEEGMEETWNSSSEDNDETYVDALDTLSQTESFFLNCSTSGLSGLDGPDLKPSGIFSTDTQTRDFMMGRFLPAAKAMASETPPYATRKQPIAQGQPRQIKKVVSGARRDPRYQYSPNNFPHYAQDTRWEESEDEDDYDGTENSSAGVCGLLPQFCLKSYFCLLNPVPGVKMQAGKPVSRIRRLRSRSLQGGSCSETENEHAMGAANEQRPIEGQRTVELHEDKIKLKSESDKITCKRQELNGSSLYRRLHVNGTSPFQNVLSLSGVLRIPEEAKNFEVNGIDSHRKGSKNIRELLSNQDSKWESGSRSPVVEKTLYIDAVHKVKSLNTNSVSSDTKELTDNKGDDFENYAKSMDMEESPSVDSSLEDIKHFNVVDGKVVLQPKSHEPLISSFQSPPDISTRDMRMNDYGQDENLILDCIKLRSTEVADNGKIDLESQLFIKLCNQESSDGINQDPIIMTSPKVSDNGGTELKSQLHMKSSDQESHSSYPKLPLHPPLPKSPSESWLKRTLPIISPRSSSTRSYLSTHIHTTVQASKMPSVDPKWETIVKTSNVQHGHLRFSAELLDPISEA